MKLVYITNSRIPTEKAHGIQIMNMCNAFANEGVDVELVVPRRINHIDKDPFDYYGIPQSFKITKLPTIDLVSVAGPFKKLAYWIEYLFFSESVFWYCLFKGNSVYYGRHELPLLYLALWKKKVYWEAHKPRYSFITKLFLRMGDGLVVISEGLQEFFLSKGYVEEKILVAHDAVDLEKFDIKITKEEARNEIGLPQDKRLVMYTGHLYPEKGVDTLAEAAGFLSDEYLIVFVGGTDEDIEAFREKHTENPRIKVIGHVSHEEIPIYLKAADVLVIPNSGKYESSSRYTSPMKLFEYMAARRPIVASDLPSLREILKEDQADFFSPDDSKSLAEVVVRTARKSDVAAETSSLDHNSVQFTWKDRARSIIEFMEKNESLG